MENDSLSVVQPDSAAVIDSANVGLSVPEIQMPTPEQLGISITSGNGNTEILSAVGDTIDFPITVSWSVNGSSLLVVPTGTANAKGLTQVGVSQESARSVKDGKEIASITFTYKIAVQDTGNLNIPVMKFEIPTQMGRPLELRSESVAVRVDEPVNMTPAIVGGMVAVVVLLAGLWRVKRRAAGRVVAAARVAAENELREEMLVLKQRVNSADSRAWLLELERVCKKFAARNFSQDFENVNLESLLKSGKLDQFGSKDGWRTLLEEFAHARYGGGKRDGFENKETWKLAMKLMGVEEE